MPKHILIMDDDKDIAQLLHIYLINEGYIKLAELC